MLYSGAPFARLNSAYKVTGGWIVDYERGGNAHWRYTQPYAFVMFPDAEEGLIVGNLEVQTCNQIHEFFRSPKAHGSEMKPLQD